MDCKLKAVNLLSYNGLCRVLSVSAVSSILSTNNAFISTASLSLGLYGCLCLYLEKVAALSYILEASERIEGAIASYFLTSLPSERDKGAARNMRMKDVKIKEIVEL